MKKYGFASMYMVYSLFIIFIIMMGSVLMVNNYKKTFLNSLKNDIKENLINHKIEKNEINTTEKEEDFVE